MPRQFSLVECSFLSQQAKSELIALRDRLTPVNLKIGDLGEKMTDIFTELFIFSYRFTTE